MQTDFTAHQRDFRRAPSKPPGRKSSIAGIIITAINEGWPCGLFSASNSASGGPFPYSSFLSILGIRWSHTIDDHLFLSVRVLAGP